MWSKRSTASIAQIQVWVSKIKGFFLNVFQRKKDIWCKMKTLQRKKFRWDTSNLETSEINNTFHAKVLFLYPPLKTSKKQNFSDIFTRYKNGTLEWNRLMIIYNFQTYSYPDSKKVFLLSGNLGSALVRHFAMSQIVM